MIKPYETARVASPAEGVIKMLHVDRNDMVVAGQVLANLEADVEKASVAVSLARSEMVAEVELRRATLEFDRRNSRRIESLYSQKAIPLHVKDEAATDATKSRLQLEKARDALRLARLELAKAEAVLRLKTIRSPITGVVVERFKTAGDFVDDDPIVEIAQIDPLIVEVIVPVELFGAIETGMTGEVIPELQQTGLHTATVTMVDRVIDAASGTFDVRLELPNPKYTIPSGLKCVVQLSPAPKSMLFSDRPLPNEGTAMPIAVEPSPQTEQTMERPAEETVGVEPARKKRQSRELRLGTQHARGADVSMVVQPADSPNPAESPVEVVGNDVGPGSTICRSLGPIESSEEVASLEQALAERSTRITHHERAETVNYRYMVLAAPQASPASTKALQARLRAAGVEHQHLLPRGENKGRISLGVYASKGWAELRRSKLAELGFNSHITAHTKTRSLYWLNVHMSAVEANELTLLQTAERVAPHSHLSLSPCSLTVSQAYQMRETFETGGTRVWETDSP